MTFHVHFKITSLLLGTVLLSTAVSQICFGFELIHGDYGRDFYFVIDGGTKDGIREGMKACVDDEDGVELYCGKVEKVNATRAGVYAPAQQEAWLELGYNVRLPDLGDIDQNKPKPRDDHRQAFVTENSAIPRRGGSWTTSYISTPLLPFQYKHPDFSIDARLTDESALWTSDETIKSSLIGLSGGYRFPFFARFDQSIDVTWRYFQPIQKEVDYDPTSGEIYAREKSTLNNIALSWGVSTALRPPSAGFYPAWNTGLCLDHATLDYRSSIEGDASGGSEAGSLAASEATLNVLSAKLGGRLERSLGGSNQSLRPGVTGIGITAMLPLVARTTWNHGAHAMPSEVAQASESTSQFEDAAQFAKARVGLQAELFVGWLF